jgi:hypothetical protein
VNCLAFMEQFFVLFIALSYQPRKLPLLNEVKVKDELASDKACLLTRRLFDCSFLSSLDSVKYKQSKEVRSNETA